MFSCLRVKSLWHLIFYNHSFKDRLNKVHQSCLKETAKRRTLLEPSPSTTTDIYDSAVPGGSRPSTSDSSVTNATLTKSLAFQ